MYRIPRDLDLSPIVGEFTTQVCVGQFDLQLTFGPVRFVVTSPVDLFKEGNHLAHWEEGRWPEPGFFDIMNTEVLRVEVSSDRIVIELANGIQIQLADNSDQY